MRLVVDDTFNRIQKLILSRTVRQRIKARPTIVHKAIVAR